MGHSRSETRVLLFSTSVVRYANHPPSHSIDQHCDYCQWQNIEQLTGTGRRFVGTPVPELKIDLLTSDIITAVDTV